VEIAFVNRDDLIELLFGEEPPRISGRNPYRQITEQDDATFFTHTRAVLGTRPERYVVRREFAPGAEIGEAATTIATTEIAFIGVDPEHRGKGYARNLLAGLTEEAMTHTMTLYVTARADTPECQAFFEHFDFTSPDLTPDDFYVLALTDEPWPHGRIMR
jgi:GNAT superfamily N-acetyltransferase